MTAMTNDETIKIHNALKRAFIEIRAAKNLEGAQVLADIFHVVPAQLSSARSFEDIRDGVLNKARRHRVEQHIQSWL